MCFSALLCGEISKVGNENISGGLRDPPLQNIYIYNLLFYKNNSIINTAKQEQTATPKRLTPKYARATPVTRAASPDQTDSVASMIEGKVITARVTYGT